MKKLFALLILLLFTKVSFAQEIPVQITPVKEYKTTNNSIKEGDTLKFVLVNDVKTFKKGTEVTGLVTEVVNNGFGGKFATVYIEQFTLQGKKLDGIIYQKGNNHPIFFEYFSGVDGQSLGFSPFRGGEAFLRPNKDIYTLYLKD